MLGCCSASKDKTALAGDVKQALGLPKLAELCCHKQGACKIPGGITMTFSIFLIRKHILKGNNIEIEIFKVKPCFHKNQWDIWHRLLKNKDYTPNSLFMRNKWYFNVPVFFQTVSGKLLITEEIWKNPKCWKMLNCHSNACFTTEYHNSREMQSCHDQMASFKISWLLKYNIFTA